MTRRILAAILLLALAIPALPVAAGQPPPCIPAGLSATYPVPCPTPTVTPTPTPTPETQPSPTPSSNCQSDGTDRPGTCSQPDPSPTPSPTPSPVPSPTPAATPSPTPDATPELPAVPPELPPTDTTGHPASESPPLYLWLIAGLAALFLVATPSRRRFVNHAHWVGVRMAHKR